MTVADVQSYKLAISRAIEGVEAAVFLLDQMLILMLFMQQRMQQK